MGKRKQETLDHLQAERALREGAILVDAEGVVWRFNDGLFEAKWDEVKIFDFKPFRAPMECDAPFTRRKP